MNSYADHCSIPEINRPFWFASVSRGQLEASILESLTWFRVHQPHPRDLRTHMGSCQNYGPCLGTRNNRCRVIRRTPKKGP